MKDWSPPDSSSKKRTHSMSDSGDSDYDVPASQVPKKVAPKAKKPPRAKKASMDKAEKAALKEKAKALDPNKCVEFITTILGANLQYTDWGKQTIQKFKDQNSLKFRVEEDSILGESCISWEMHEPGAEESREMEVSLICWDIDELIQQIRQNTLLSYFLSYRRAFPNHRVILAVSDLSACTTRKNSRTTRQCSKDDINKSVLELELRTGVSLRNFNNSSELFSMITHFVKSLSKLPSKEKNESLMASLGWYAKGENKQPIRVDNDLNGLGQLWNQHLSQFNLSSLGKAKAVTEAYPTPLSLVNAYNDIDTVAEKEKLLQNLEIKKRPAIGPGRLGPELSKKIYRFFTEENENSVL